MSKKKSDATAPETYQVFQLSLFVHEDDGEFIDPKTDKRFNVYADLVTAPNREAAEQLSKNLAIPSYGMHGHVFKATLVDTPVISLPSNEFVQQYGEKITIYED